MSRYAVFLRGMNLGGRRLSNADLSAHIAALGFADVATFRASGNVVPSAEGHSPAELQAKLQAGLSSALDYDVPTFVRSAEQLAQLTAREPFAPDLLERSTGKLQVALLHSAPGAAARAEALAMGTDDDRLTIEGAEMYWLPANGVGHSALDMRAIDRILGGTTVRTMGTLEQTLARHFAS